MSNIYITEPVTKGKVVLHTTVGDIDIELWAKETPKAVRNFVQLCLEGYYDNTIFHRIVKDFIVQGGDPTGTGTGGESIYGGSFPDEFHSRLRFSHRGIVAMATSGSNTNGSQFFITLAKADELQKKHTIFGKVTGDTIFNVLKMNEFQVDDNDRPLYPPKILGVEVLWNPFEDIVPRVTKKSEQELPKPEPEKKTTKKNLGLLSFGDEAEEEETELGSAPRMKSSHAFPSQTAKNKTASSALRSQQERTENKDAKSDRTKPLPVRSPSDSDEGGSDEDKEEEGDRRGEDDDDDRRALKPQMAESGQDKALSFDEKMRAKILVKRQMYDKDKPKVRKDEQQGKDQAKDNDKDKTKLPEDNRLKKSKLSFKKTSVASPDGDTAPPARAPKHRRVTDERQVLVKLEKFKGVLKETPNSEEDSWKSHELVFEKEPKVVDPMMRNDDNSYVVYDPLKKKGMTGGDKKMPSYHQRRLGSKNTEKW
jgi:peptidyl-prolyl cis-trans isomerase SDCCAG10